MSLNLAEVLREFLRHQLSSGKGGHAMIFPSRSGGEGPQGERWFVRRLRDYLKKAEVEARAQPFHQLRHTFCTELLMAGIPIYRVSRWMGHASQRITEARYAHWISPEDEHQGVDALAQNRTLSAHSGKADGINEGA